MIARRGFLAGVVGALCAPIAARMWGRAQAAEAMPLVWYDFERVPPENICYYDLGAWEEVGQLALTRVRDNPQSGQYVFDEERGTYTFSAADADKSMTVSVLTPSVVKHLAETEVSEMVLSMSIPPAPCVCSRSIGFFGGPSS